MKNRLSRRQFIAGSTLAAAGVAAAGTLGWRAVFGSGGPKISVGYVEAVDELWAGGARVVPVASIGSAPVARAVHILGATPGFELSDGASASLDAIYPGGARFGAWSYRGGDAGSASSALRFAMPDDGVTFRLAIDDPSASASGGDQADPTLALGGDGTALRPGAYLLAVRGDVWDSSGRLPARDDEAWADMASVLLTVAPAA